MLYICLNLKLEIACMTSLSTLIKVFEYHLNVAKENWRRRKIFSYACVFCPGGHQKTKHNGPFSCLQSQLFLKAKCEKVILTEMEKKFNYIQKSVTMKKDIFLLDPQSIKYCHFYKKSEFQNAFKHYKVRQIFLGSIRSLFYLWFTIKFVMKRIYCGI